MHAAEIPSVSARAFERILEERSVGLVKAASASVIGQSGGIGRGLPEEDVCLHEDMSSFLQLDRARANAVPVVSELSQTLLVGLEAGCELIDKLWAASLL